MTDDDDDLPAPALDRRTHRRVAALTRQREDARREAAVLQERLRLLEAGYARPQPPPAAAPQAPVLPRREDFATDEEWIDARAEAKVQQALEARQLYELRQRQVQEQQQREQQWQAREQEFRRTHADYDERIEVLGGQLSPQLWQSLADSELAPELAYHLARHPDELQRLNTLQPLALSRALGRLEAQVSAPPGRSSSPPSPVPKPPPPSPISGNGAGAPRLLTDLSDAEVAALSQREYEALYQRQFPGAR